MEEKIDLKNKFLILFWGYFIPLQGVEYIVKAAKYLEKYQDIHFLIIGSGQDYKKSLDLATRLDIKNINFAGRIEHTILPNYIEKADICLGIFGDTEKTQRVIPNKVYEAIAMKKPVITADTPAARELFTDRKNILFCKAADGRDLAQKILELKNNPDLRNKIAENGYKLFKEKLTPAALAKRLLNLI